MEARLWPIDFEEHGVPREEIQACAEQHRAAAALPTQCTPVKDLHGSAPLADRF